MIRHEPVLPPEFIYPIEEWRVVEREFTPEFLAQAETLFATANGHLGIRGGFEEGTPSFESGTFVNAFHETWPIPYGESAHGFATTGQTIVNVPDGSLIRLYVDDEVFDLARATLLQYERALDFRSGTLDRLVLWETATGKQVRVQSRRLVSFTDRHLAAIQYEVTVLNTSAPVVISSELAQHPQPRLLAEDDPRLARRFDKSVLDPKAHDVKENRVMRGFITHKSKMTLACGIDHVIETECEFSAQHETAEKSDRVVFSAQADAGKPIRLTKFITYHTSRKISVPEQIDRARRVLDRGMRRGFQELLESQREYLEEFWKRADVEIGHENSRERQCMRWDVFQLLQATARADGSGVPAKGLTGQAYEGHYFWDMEMFMIPFLIYTEPRSARNLLLFRYWTLPAARQRAQELSQRGALYPWRTINGQEASAYYAAGTAQYHINAAIAYAIRKYVEVTGDQEFLHRYGAEILIETARLWIDLGFYSDRQGGHFCIHAVTGPDEYATVVDNNTYTNLMAQAHLRYAAEVVDIIRSQHADAYRQLVYRTGVGESEPDEWRRAAEAMYVAYDEKLGIHPQDDSFLDHEPWDFAGTPAENYPLLLHYHPLVIYRRQVLKQTDVVFAMFLLGDDFTPEQKKRNFDYYDPITTGDSSLSACIQSIVASEIAYPKMAIEYWKYALLMDFADIGGNVKDGCHIAACGGSWMAAVYGIAGMRDHGGELSFHPKPYLEHLQFALQVRGQRLEVRIEDNSVHYLLRGSEGLTIAHCGERLVLRDGQELARDISETRKPVGISGDRNPKITEAKQSPADQTNPSEQVRKAPSTRQHRAPKKNTR